ncbi:MAG TPA: PaaI family thioesterase, partial [Polyangiaceae bacterium LLY-WYZ-15_(1-7)]|nr:PaaI family thioesterase [Polyangiaceae bacterium LLY-WYZ-15_(1-7)]
MSFLEALARARREGDLSEVVAAVPYMRAMGMEMRVDEEGVLGVLPFAEHHIGNYAIRAIHGGVLGALLESTAAITVLYTSESVHLPRIVNITVEYLRSAKAETTFARSRFTKQGRRVVSVRTVAWQGDAAKPVAAAQS